MSKAILVATDDSPCARGAAASATALAAILKGRIEALSIVDPVDFGGSAAGAAPELAERQARRAHDQAHAAVDRVAEDARAAGVPVETSVVEGQVRAVLDDRARVGDVDLVAAGTHGRTGLDRYLLGSVATHLVRTSPVPVLVVHGAVDSLPTYETVVVPTDGSRHAARAADLGAEIAAASGGTVHALHAADGRPSDPVVDVLDRATAAGVDAIETVRDGRPIRVIESYVDETGADLVVMGTHGRTGLDRRLVGSVTERAVRVLDAPVLSVYDDEDH
jgi:nucleotide-binding universal stress UspA family protein